MKSKALEISMYTAKEDLSLFLAFAISLTKLYTVCVVDLIEKSTLVITE